MADSSSTRLLNPRANALSSATAPLSQVPSNPSINPSAASSTTTSPESKQNSSLKDAAGESNADAQKRDISESIQHLSIGDPSQRTEPLTAAEEEELLTALLAHKTTGNTYFSPPSPSSTSKTPTETPPAKPDYELSISYYRSALLLVPTTLDPLLSPQTLASITLHRTILHANIAAAFIKLSRWKEAEEAATASLIASGENDEKRKEREHEKRVKREQAAKNKTKAVESAGSTAGQSDRIEELDSDDDENDEEGNNVDRELSTVEWGKNWKARLRRAKSREMQNTWQSLSGALDDYTILADRSVRFDNSIPAVDKRSILAAKARLPAKVEEKKQAEISEMMGKLKGLGDTILKPFGLSTDNFKMVKDEKTGGYSMNFGGGGAKK